MEPRENKPPCRLFVAWKNGKFLLHSIMDETITSQMIQKRIDGKKTPAGGDRRLLGSAAAAMAQNPRASMDSIARACGIGRATLNRRYSSRQDLMRAIALDTLDVLDEITEEMPDDSSAMDYLNRILPSLISLGDRFRVLDQDPALLEIPEIRQALERQRQESLELSRNLKEEGALDVSVPDAYFAAALDGLLFSSWSGIADGFLASNDAPDLIFRTLFAGLGPVKKAGNSARSAKQS